MASKGLFSKINEAGKHFYQRDNHRRIQSNQNAMHSIRGNHRRTFSNTDTDFNRMFSKLPQKQNLQELQQEPMTPDSLTSTANIKLPQQETQYEKKTFLGLLNSVIAYQNEPQEIYQAVFKSKKSRVSREYEKLAFQLRELEEIKERNQKEQKKMEEALQEQVALTSHYEQKLMDYQKKTKRLEKHLKVTQDAIQADKKRKMEGQKKMGDQQKKPIIIKHLGKASPTGSIRTQSQYILPAPTKHYRSDSYKKQ